MGKTNKYRESRAVIAILRLFSLLPFRLLYLWASFTGFVMQHGLRYRRKVITENLQRSFPDKSPQDIARIRREFYLHLADLMVETIKLISVPRREMEKRVIFTGRALELFKAYHEKGQSLICLTGHQGNWEWTGPLFGYHQPLAPVPAYLPLANPHFDALMMQIRGRYAHSLIPAEQVGRRLIRMLREEPPMAIGLIADQSPPQTHMLWVDFLNQKTAFNSGPEKVARMLRLPVCFLSLRKQKRGHYLADAWLISDTPHLLPEAQLTREFARLMEQEIKAAPACWLWSHRRWKKKYTEAL